MRRKYTPEDKVASNRYTSLKSRLRLDYDLEQYWTRKDFINWYTRKPKKCCYCGCTSKELDKFYENTNSKRKNTRGKTLEIERKKDKPYSQDNCDFSCYWCNNAKSDVFSPDEFHRIGKAIGKVIREKLKL